ncbi:hypothetical protein QQF64_018359, partial [Cirrhinus molitorella]
TGRQQHIQHHHSEHWGPSRMCAKPPSLHWVISEQHPLGRVDAPPTEGSENMENRQGR